MSSAQLSAPRAGSLARGRSRAQLTVPPAPAVLLGSLLGLALWSAFDHGAADEAASARVEVIAVLIALLAAVAWLGTGTLRVRCGRAAGVGLGLLGAFCAWSALSVAWSVAPDRSWLEANRSLLYLLTLVLAIACAASWRGTPAALTTGLELLGAAVALYAIGQKLLPGLHLSGVNLDQAGVVPRLQEPLGYWNALGLLLALSAPMALLAAGDPARSPARRVASLLLLGGLVLTIALTLSRGGLIALVVALGVFVARGGRPLRSLLWLALAVLAVLPALLLGLTSHRLTAAGVPLGQRESAGLVLLSVLLLGLLAAAAAARPVLVLERRLSPPPRTRRRIWRGLAGLVLAVALGGLLALSFSHRGLTGSVSHAWHSFTVTHEATVTDPTRLLSADSANRWVWWKEALGAFSDRPLAGWGSGSFPVVHLLYRRDTLSVDQPHSMPLQWLAETGLIGTICVLGALALLLAAASQAVVRAGRAPERAIRAALLAVCAAYLVHSLYDWDWDIPGVTLPFLLALGGLVGVPRPGDPAGRRRFRAGWLALAALGLSAGAAAAAIPSLAATRAADAVVAAGSGSPADLALAQRDASTATTLDPLSDAGLRVDAAIALRAGQRGQARGDLLHALVRDPTDAQAWPELAYAELSLGDLADAQRAAQRARQLDPLGSITASVAGGLAGSVTLRAAPPRDSATAIPTP